MFTTKIFAKIEGISLAELHRDYKWWALWTGKDAHSSENTDHNAGRIPDLTEVLEIPVRIGGEPTWIVWLVPATWPSTQVWHDFANGKPKPYATYTLNWKTREVKESLVPFWAMPLIAIDSIVINVSRQVATSLRRI